MKDVVAALVVVMQALAKHGINYMTINSHANDRVSVNVQCPDEDQLVRVAAALGLPVPTIRHGNNNTYWYDTSGEVGGVYVGAYGAHRKLPAPAPVDDPALGAAAEQLVDAPIGVAS